MHYKVRLHISLVTYTTLNLFYEALGEALTVVDVTHKKYILCSLNLSYLSLTHFLNF